MGKNLSPREFVLEGEGEVPKRNHSCQQILHISFLFFHFYQSSKSSPYGEDLLL